jgi:hypothetical protein
MEKRLHYYNKERDRWISENGFFVTDPILIEIEQMSYNALWKIKFLFFISKLLNIKIIVDKKEKWRYKGIIYDTVNGKYIKKDDINLDNLSPVRH